MSGELPHQTGREAVVLECADDIIHVTIEMDAALNYALAHNGISPLRRLEVENFSEVDRSDLMLELFVTAPVDGKVADPFRFQLPAISAGDTGVLRDLRRLTWSLDAKAFAGLEEAVTGSVTMRVSHSGGAIEAGASLRLLARDEWWAGSMEESLAAFVTPRAKAIRDLLSDASDLLGQRTGDPSMQGYQGGTERALKIAESVYDAMAARKIRYINPPASFEGAGQKIRPPHEVLVERWGTCLDLATTYAGALEGAGLNPVLVLCRGHAFAGHLLDDLQLPELITHDPDIITNWVDSGAFVPTETVSLCLGKELPYREATGAPSAAGWWTHQLPEVKLIDIRSAHRSIRPIPATHVEDGVQVVEVERGPAPVAVSLNTPAQTKRDEDSGPKGGQRPTQVAYPPRVERWRNSLLDLSFRNPLLNMKSSRGGALDLHIAKGALGDFEDLVFSGAEINILPHDQLAEVHMARGARTAQEIEPEELKALLLEENVVFGACPKTKYVSRLRGLLRRAKTVHEETGANNLYLALGALNWEDAGRKARAPLFLIPVELKARRAGPFQLRIDEGGYAQPNQCLLEKLRVSKGLTIPAFQNPDEDESGIDLAGSLQAIRMAMIEAELPYSVDETAHLALLQFSTLQLWQDLSDNWELFLQSPVVRHLIETPTDSFVDPVGQDGVDVGAAEAEAYCPVPVDGAQLEAVSLAESGRSFVLEGPPGTGKSQTITNLIANALAKGKRVLFVAEKQAALEVVRRRLAAVGLDDLCLDLHGKSQSPEKVRGQLRRALQLQQVGNDESWQAIWSLHVTGVEKLRRYPAAIHDTSSAALSIWAARQSLLATGSGPVADVSKDSVGPEFDMEEANVISRALTESLYTLGVEMSNHPWGLAGTISLEDPDDRRSLAEAVAEVSSSLATLEQSPAIDLLALVGADDLQPAIEWYRAAEIAPRIPSAEEVRTALTPQSNARIESARKASQALISDSASFMQVFGHEVLTADLDHLLVLSKAADEKLFKGKARKAVRAELEPFSREGSEIDLSTLTPTLEALIQLRSRSRDISTELAAIPGLEGSYSPLDPSSETAIEAKLALLQASSNLLAAVPTADSALDAISTSGLAGGGSSALESFVEAWKELERLLAANDNSVAEWCGDKPLLPSLRRSIPAWLKDTDSLSFVQLGRWLAVRSGFDDLDRLGFTGLFDSVRDGTISPDELEAAVRRGVAQASIQRALRSPMLAGFDGARRDQEIADFSRAEQELRESMVAEIPAQIVRQRSFRSDRLMGKVGELNRELSRKRGGLKVRELLSHYGSIIGEITPCVMMSPHSVARFLPAGALDFDIVVFDEASQIKVAESIGAMGRARAAVVVGDSQQMPPSATFASGSEEEEQLVGIPVDMESVLSEAVESNLPRVWLSWHYRSKHESLISFSNHFYYEGRLSSFPRPPSHGDDSDSFGVSMRQIGGVWERGKANVNRGEAEAILKEVEMRLNEGDERSIGIVTLNANQQALILDLLEDSSDPKIVAALNHPREPLFVKNLENVQGDERDVILFSLAFSPDPETDRMSLNFGPLNNAGGERRLNVAVTRARSQVILFASFEPRHIDLSRTSSVGLAHLRAYMEMAVRGGEKVPVLQPIQARDGHRDEVQAALEERGLTVRTGVGQSDFRVDLGVAEGPEGPWLAVFLDGPLYKSRRTVGDREVLPPAVLTGSMGWADSARVWLPDWIRDRNEVVDAIVEKLRFTDVAKADELNPVSAPGVSVKNDATGSDANGLDASGLGLPTAHHFNHTSEAGPINIEPEPDIDLQPAPMAQEQEVFVGAHSEPVGTVAVLDGIGVNRSNEESVRRELDEVISLEGPIEAKRLARIVARRFDLRRVAASRSQKILALAPAEQVVRTPFGDFVWPSGLNPAEYRKFRVAADGDPRAIEEVAPEEVINAMAYLAAAGGGIGVEELLRETLALLGGRRVTAQIRARLESIMESGIVSGALARAGEVIVKP